MVKIKLPTVKTVNGGALHAIASDIIVLSCPAVADGEYSVYTASDQILLENILNHESMYLIASEGGEVEGYLMYAEIDAVINGNSVYTLDVPEGLPHREMRYTDGSKVSTIVKNMAGWCDSHIKQKFSEDKTMIYLPTNPQTQFLKASELKVFIDAFGVRLLTLPEYDNITVI